MIDGRGYYRSGLDTYPFFQVSGEDYLGWGHYKNQVTTGSGDDFDYANWSYYTHPYGRIVRHQTVHDKWNVYRGDSTLMNYTGPDYNTGWMHGNIRMATCSDIDSSDLKGNELLVDSSNAWIGGFASNTNGWTVNSNGTFTSVSGRGRLTNTQSGDRVRADSGALKTVVGEYYTLSFETYQSNGFLHLGTQAGGVQYAANIALNGSGFVEYTFKATTTEAHIQIGVSSTGNGDDVDYDNISLRRAVADRTPNNNGLQVNGEIIRASVAPGADLVGYSGWGTGNYLSQPPNTNLDFGTGDFSAMGWFKSDHSGSGANECFFFRGQTDTNSYAMIEPYIRADGRVDVLTRNAAEQTSIFTSNISVLTKKWIHWCMVRSHGRMYWYINGELDASGTNTRDVTPSTAAKKTFRIGNSWNGAKPLPGSVALFRISSSAPTHKQLRKIYKDEKMLFRDNAKATLYGDADHVSALAYDQSTKLLHAGTTGNTRNGRSVFQGLVRIDNTDDTVSTVISTSNGMVAEE
jgi:hypothetical protein